MFSSQGAGSSRDDAGLAAAFPVLGSPTGAGGPRTVLEAFPLVSGDGRYRRRDFEYLPEPPPREPRPWHSVLEPRAAAAPARRIFDLAPIVRGCSWLRHCHADRATAQEANRRTLHWLERCQARFQALESEEEVPEQALSPPIPNPDQSPASRIARAWSRRRSSKTLPCTMGKSA